MKDHILKELAGPLDLTPPGRLRHTAQQSAGSTPERWLDCVQRPTFITSPSVLSLIDRDLSLIETSDLADLSVKSSRNCLDKI